MITFERREKIKNIMLNCKTVTVANMAETFDVSTETIRRDFEALEKDGFLVKTHGGASLVPKKNIVVSQKVKNEIMITEKQRMAKAAAQTIRPYDCVFMDHSTSVLAMTDFLGDKPMTVVTNSLPVVERLSRMPQIRLCMTGGDFNPMMQAFFSEETNEYMQNHFLDKAFLSCSSIHRTHGICDSEGVAADLHEIVIQNVDCVYMIADHTKFDRTSFKKACNIEEIDYLITDDEVSADWKSVLEEANTGLMICPP